MICKKVAIWGKAGSGKTTLAVNLGLALAGRNFLVGLVSANLLYAEIQSFFGQTIYEDKGLFNAMQDQTGSVQEMFWKCGLHENLFLLSLPNQYSGLEADGVSLDMVKKLINGCCLHFDYLIIDGKEDILNPLSSVGMSLADEILTLYRPAVTSLLWHQAMRQFRTQLCIEGRMTPILNADLGVCVSFSSNVKLEFTHNLPYVKASMQAENEGRPLYLLKDGEAKRYARQVDKIADQICARR